MARTQRQRYSRLLNPLRVQRRSSVLDEELATELVVVNDERVKDELGDETSARVNDFATIARIIEEKVEVNQFPLEV